MDLEQPRVVMAFSAIPGSLVYALWQTMMGRLAGEAFTRREWMHLVGNIVCAGFTGGSSAFFLGPVIAAHLPPGLGDPYALGFVLGLLSWEGIPAAIRFAKAWAEKRTSKEMGQ